MKRWLTAAGLLVCLHLQAAVQQVDVTALARSVARRAERYVNPEDYKGSVYLQGLAEAALASGDPLLVNKTDSLLRLFADGRLKGYGSFIAYRTGGNALAEWAWHRRDARLREVALRTAAEAWELQRRNRDGLMMPDWREAEEKNALFVDVVLSVTPYLLYAGLLEARPEYLDYAVRMVDDVYRQLCDPATGLVHQARGCKWLPEGVLTQDCWSRGNGWLAMAFAALLRDLPRSHPGYAPTKAAAKRFFTAVLRYQGPDGLWRQEMTDPDAYTELSGSALLLYGIGTALEQQVLPARLRQHYLRGLQGMIDYVDTDGNTGSTCSGCLAYSDGSKAAYASHPCNTNEAHAFGPVLLCLGQALRMGIDRIETPREAGSAMQATRPRCHVRFIEERKEDIAWENDRIALRIYSREVRSKVGSGVDFWAKSVDYPIVEKWYALNDSGQAYHEDRGEGFDFYNVGKNRGVGGTGIWAGGELFVSQPYANYRIVSDSPEELEFEIDYQPYTAAGETICESKRIRMILGTHFYQVTSTVRTASGRDVLLAVGLTSFGQAAVERDPARGLLSLTERIGDREGSIGSAVLADPARTRGFAASGDDELLLLQVASGEPVTYYVGAAWSGDLRFDPFATQWPRLLRRQSWPQLNELYR